MMTRGRPVEMESKPKSRGQTRNGPADRAGEGGIPRVFPQKAAEHHVTQVPGEGMQGPVFIPGAFSQIAGENGLEIREQEGERPQQQEVGKGRLSRFLHPGGYYWQEEVKAHQHVEIPEMNAHAEFQWNQQQVRSHGFQVRRDL